MKLFELSKWKGGQSALRVMGVLTLLGAASHLMGACSGSRPLTERPEASTRPGSSRCKAYPREADLDDTSNTVCISSRGTLNIKRSTLQIATLCFRQSEPTIDEDKSPFEKNETRVPVGGPKEVITQGVYEFAPLTHKGCNWSAPTDGGFPDTGGMSGTLEVGSGSEPPEQR